MEPRVKSCSLLNLPLDVVALIILKLEVEDFNKFIEIFRFLKKKKELWKKVLYISKNKELVVHKGTPFDSYHYLVNNMKWRAIIFKTISYSDHESRSNFCKNSWNLDKLIKKIILDSFIDSFMSDISYLKYEAQRHKIWDLLKQLELYQYLEAQGCDLQFMITFFEKLINYHHIKQISSSKGYVKYINLDISSISSYDLQYIKLVEVLQTYFFNKISSSEFTIKFFESDIKFNITTYLK